MPTKTYVPGLRLVVKGAHRYATRYQSTLEANLSEAQYACLVELINALAECLIILGDAPINP